MSGFQLENNSNFTIKINKIRMTEFLYLLTQAILIFVLLFLIVFLIYSFLEKEKNAIVRTLPLLSIFAALLIFNSLKVFTDPLLLAFDTIFFLVLGLIVLPFGNKRIKVEMPDSKFDERDIMFSRNELKEGTEKFKNYYGRKIENKEKDDLFRKEPGLMSPDSKFYNPLMYNAAAATFSAVDLLQPLVEKKNSDKFKSSIDDKEISSFLKKWTIKLGAVDVGFTLIRPHHIYSHIGRGKDYGNAVELNHKYALAFTVEMNHESLSYTPKGPIIMESAQQYLNAGTIAVQIAQFIRNMGFDARAHIDANYRLICPVVAQDAGLGTIGRIGLLMTPKLGPRVRIGVVTTDLELEINQKPMDSTTIQFCETCKKCATNCPSKAISSESGKMENEWLPWKINHEKCFTYWCKAGTDCGRCVTVCPYSHPNNFIHNIIRLGIKRNPVNRWLALKLDDYFYKRKPAVKSLNSWSVLGKS
jgi:reductive dehalogenase